MKKYSIILLFLLLSTLVGCGDSKPVKLVKTELNRIQNLDEDAIQSFISYDDMVHSGSESGDGGEATQAIRLFFENFSYRVLSSSIADDSAIVNVEIQNIDTQALAKDLCLEIIASSSSPNATDSLASTDSYFTLLCDVLSSNEYQLTTSTAHFNLNLTDGKWAIRNDDTLEDAIVSGFISYLNDPDLVSPEEIIAKIFEDLSEQSPEEWVSYLDMCDIFSTGSTLYTEVDLALATEISECFSYTIENVTEDQDTATAVLTVTSLDMGSVLDNYLDKLWEYASTTEAIRATDTELADKTAVLLKECLESNPDTYTKTIEIEFKNNGTNWEMKLNDDFTDALLGNMSEAVENFQSQALPE